MSAVDLKSAIIDIAQPVSGGEASGAGTTASDKVNAISVILRDNLVLKSDPEIVDRVLTLTDRNSDSAIQKFREQLIYDASRKEEGGIVTLTFPEKATAQEKTSIIWSLQSARFDNEQKTLTIPPGAKLSRDQLWKFIEEHDVEQLIIQQRQGLYITYSEKVLGQLLERKPTIADLTETYTLTFPGGEKLVETKAKLLLCGEFFERMLCTQWVETEKKEVDFTKSEVFCSAFRAILNNVETDEIDRSLLSNEAFISACDFLQFSPISAIPEGAFGPAEWQKYYGIEVDDVPPLPGNIDFNPEKEVMVLMPKGLSINKMGELIQHPKEGHATKYRFIWDKITAEHGSKEAENSYWFRMSKGVEEESLGKTRDEQLKAAEKKGGRAPTLLEAIAACSLVYVSTGERILSDEPWRYTVCQERVQGRAWKLVVGGFSASGLHVAHYDYDNVGAAVLRKF